MCLLYTVDKEPLCSCRRLCGKSATLEETMSFRTIGSLLLLLAVLTACQPAAVTLGPAQPELTQATDATVPSTTQIPEDTAATEPVIATPTLPEMGLPTPGMAGW